MGDGADDDWRPPLRAGPGLRRREVVIAAGAGLPFVEDDWRGAFVVVERGEVELQCSLGATGRFGAGSHLWFDGLGLCRLYNPGAVPAVLIALFRDQPTR